MRAFLAALLAGLLALTAPVQAMNPVFIRCTIQPPAHTYPVYGGYGVANLTLGDPATQLGAELTSPLINGIMIKFTWGQVEPSPGVFTWAVVDQAIAQVEGAGKTVTLALAGDGLAGHTPAWLFSTGAGYLATQDYKPSAGANCGAALNLVYPWDTTYQGYYQQLIAAMGARYNSDPMIKGVKVDLFNYDTWEVGYTTINSGLVITCPSGPVTVPDLNALWSAAGYRPALALSAYQTILGFYQAAFPGKMLITMYLGNPGMPGVAPDGSTNLTYESWQLDAFIPQCETQAGQLCGSAFNGFKLNYQGTPSAVAGMNAILAASAAGYFTDLQDDNLISTTSTDCQGANCASPTCVMNGGGGSPCDGWALLKQVHNYIVTHGINMFEATGPYDVVTWNPSVTDPIWRVYGVRGVQP